MTNTWKTLAKPIESIFGVSRAERFSVSASELKAMLTKTVGKPVHVPKPAREKTVPAAPEVVLSSVKPRDQSAFVRAMKKHHNELYAFLLKLAPLELTLPTAYLDFQEALRIIGNNREIDVNPAKVKQALDDFIELSATRYLAAKLKLPPKDVDRIIGRIWPTRSDTSL